MRSRLRATFRQRHWSQANVLACLAIGYTGATGVATLTPS
jgi:hypothetical protein